MPSGLTFEELFSFSEINELDRNIKKRKKIVNVFFFLFQQFFLNLVLIDIFPFIPDSVNFDINILFNYKKNVIVDFCVILFIF